VVKAFTLGAGDFDVAYRVVLKQLMPRVLNSIRLNLKAVMLFLFAGEMIASTDGLAYRIALLRRHMGMDVIIPYVLWVALLCFWSICRCDSSTGSSILVQGGMTAMALIQVEKRLHLLWHAAAAGVKQHQSRHPGRRIRLSSRPDRLR